MTTNLSSNEKELRRIVFPYQTKVEWLSDEHIDCGLRGAKYFVNYKQSDEPPLWTRFVKDWCCNGWMSGRQRLSNSKAKVEGEFNRHRPCANCPNPIPDVDSCLKTEKLPRCLFYAKCHKAEKKKNIGCYKHSVFMDCFNPYYEKKFLKDGQIKKIYEPEIVCRLGRDVLPMPDPEEPQRQKGVFQSEVSFESMEAMQSANDYYNEGQQAWESGDEYVKEVYSAIDNEGFEVKGNANYFDYASYARQRVSKTPHQYKITLLWKQIVYLLCNQEHLHSKLNWLWRDFIKQVNKYLQKETPKRETEKILQDLREQIIHYLVVNARLKWEEWNFVEHFLDGFINLSIKGNIGKFDLSNAFDLTKEPPDWIYSFGSKQVVKDSWEGVKDKFKKLLAVDGYRTPLEQRFKKLPPSHDPDWKLGGKNYLPNPKVISGVFKTSISVSAFLETVKDETEKRIMTQYLRERASQEEIARQEGVSQSTVSRVIYRCIKTGQRENNTPYYERDKK